MKKIVYSGYLEVELDVQALLFVNHQNVGGNTLIRKRRRRKDPIDELIGLAPGILALTFIYLWFKFGNLTVPFVVLGLILAISLGLAFYFYRKHKRKLMEKRYRFD